MSTNPIPLIAQGGIVQGSIVTLSLTSETTTDTADAIVEKVSADLAVDGRLALVGSPQVGGSILNAFLGAVESLSFNQPFQVDLQVLCNTSFQNQNDPLTIVEHFFSQETGFYPTAASTTGIQAPGQSQAVLTGQPGANPSGVGGSNSSGGKSITDAVSAFFANLTSTAKTILIVLVGVVVLALVLIAYGPNVGKVASAVA